MRRRVRVAVAAGKGRNEIPDVFYKLRAQRIRYAMGRAVMGIFHFSKSHSSSQITTRDGRSWAELVEFDNAHAKTLIGRIHLFQHLGNKSLS